MNAFFCGQRSNELLRVFSRKFIQVQIDYTILAMKLKIKCLKPAQFLFLPFFYSFIPNLINFNIMHLNKDRYVNPGAVLTNNFSSITHF